MKTIHKRKKTRQTRKVLRRKPENWTQEAKSIPRMDNEKAKSTARAERIEIKYESLILAQDKRWRRA